MKRLLTLVPFVILLMALVPMAASAQAPVCDEEIVVVKDDWLAKYADKYLGNPLAWPAIFELHNAAATADPVKFPNKIINPNLIEVGWTICIPSAEDAETFLATYTGDQPKYGGSAIIGTTGDIINFNEYMQYFISYPVFNQVYDRLLQYDYNMKPMPRLATSWKINDEGTSITLNLRQGVKFHNGREFVADDVVAAMDLAQGDTTGHNMNGRVQNVDKAHKVDDYTVRIDFKSPTPNILDILNEMSIMAPESYDTLDQTAIGTGPFMLKEWIPGDHVTFVRNENYWEEGVPYLDEVTFKPYADLEALVTALESGIIDGAVAVPPKDYVRLKAAGVDVTFGQPGAMLYSLTVNPPDPDQPESPLSDKRVRQALNWALDRETIVDQALFGVGEATISPFPKTSIAYFEDLATAYTFDLDKAKELLTEAGYPDGGFDLVTITIQAYPETTDMAQIMKADLAKVGINLEIEPLDSAAYSPRHLGSPETNGSATFDLDFTFVGRSHMYPLALFDNSSYRHFNSPIYPRGDFPEGYVDALNSAGATADKDAQRELFRTVHEILNDNCHNLPISWKFTLFASQPWLKGMGFSVGDEVKMANAWLTK
jgi:peptide/nickel transport system substrate-binding protein